MDRPKLITIMLELLQEALDEQADGNAVGATTELQLVGGEAAITSLGLVSFISDVESSLADDFDLEVTLVSENALSRKNSPFRSVDALAEYVLELAAEREAG